MGLSASQARLLTITARKSDCEYESMRLSHQKIALSRDMNCVSAEYQDSLNQTKLMYDFYGNDSKANDLTYDLLMSPSALNNFIPMPLTDTSGRVVLSPALANAARAAGIPQEGMGGLPSSDIRNTFVAAMANNGVITQNMAENIQLTTYNQEAGVGSDNFVNVNIKQLTLTDLLLGDKDTGEGYFNDIVFDLTDLLLDAGGSNLDLVVYKRDGDGNALTNKELGRVSYNYDNEDPTCKFTTDSGKDVVIDATKLTFADLFNSEYAITINGLTWDNDQLRGKNGLYDWSVIDKVATSTLWEIVFNGVDNVLKNGDAYTDAALQYAQNKVIESIESLSYVDENGDDIKNFSNAAFRNNHSHRSMGKVSGWITSELANYVGYVSEGNSGDDYNDGYGLNLTYMAEAYMTYFAMYYDGLSNTAYNVDKLYQQSNMVDDFFTFNVASAADTTGNNMQIAGFYDALFNQICIKGWVENDKVEDKDYTQQMLKDGAMYIASIADDGFYYQDNYSTNSYIKEVTDETKIAQAEAKYNREKEKINYKENILDMKMKNLDTEITALTTEYDTVKSVITKNIEKSFKRYEA